MKAVVCGSKVSPLTYEDVIAALNECDPANPPVALIIEVSVRANSSTPLHAYPLKHRTRSLTVSWAAHSHHSKTSRRSAPSALSEASGFTWMVHHDPIESTTTPSPLPRCQAVGGRPIPERPYLHPQITRPSSSVLGGAEGEGWHPGTHSVLRLSLCELLQGTWRHDR